MPRLGCDTRIENPTINIADRVFDLRNRVAWLKNVEFCLLGDQNDRLTKMKNERYNIEKFNNDLRQKIQTHTEKFGTNMTTVNEIDCINYKRNQVLQNHNQLLFIQKSLNNRLKSLDDQKNKKFISKSNQEIPNDKIIPHRIRQIQDRLTSVKLINKTLNNCKDYLQCDLDLLRKELPNVKKDIRQKFHQKIILKKEFTKIVADNKRRLIDYQQLLDHTEAQSRQRRTMHEQVMASVAEQLENQYQVQMTAGNEMTSPFESRKLPDNPISVTMMNMDEIIQICSMYDQFYNIMMAGFPIDIDNSEQLKTATNEVSARTVALLTMTNRMMEEKEQIYQQINHIDKLLNSIEMSINLKNDTRHKILDTIFEQRQNLEIVYLNDTVEEQNRILRQINDFIIVLSKALCGYIGTQSLTEPPIDFIERLQYISDLVLKTVKTITTESVDENVNDHNPTSPIIRRNDE